MADRTEKPRRLKKSSSTDIVKKKKSAGVLSKAELDAVSTDEREHIREYARMFRELRGIAKTLEADLKQGSPNSRGVYALCTVYSQQREVIADIRTLTDLSSQIDMLNSVILHQLCRAIAQQLLNSFYHISRIITETSNPKQTQFALDSLRDVIKTVTSAIDQEYERAAGQVVEMFTPAATNEPKSKKKSK